MGGVPVGPAELCAEPTGVIPVTCMPYKKQSYVSEFF
jgi:hypothetical protein